MQAPLRVLLVEDEVLLLMQLEALLEGQGHVVAGTALSSREALALAAEVEADLALVDVRLADGASGVDVGRLIAERTGMAVAFMTATPKRIPGDFSGALGVISKPYTREGIRSALDYIREGLRDPPPRGAPPRSLELAPSFARRWAGSAAGPGRRLEGP